MQSHASFRCTCSHRLCNRTSAMERFAIGNCSVNRLKNFSFLEFSGCQCFEQTRRKPSCACYDPEGISTPLHSFTVLRHPLKNRPGRTLVSCCKPHGMDEGTIFRNQKKKAVNSATPESISSSSASHGYSSRLVQLLMVVPEWADAQKESGMPQRQRRAFYSHDDWLCHRSSLRHIRHIMSSLSSRVILSLIPPVFVITAVAAVIAAYNSAVEADRLPSFLPVLHAASLPYELTAPALALLLVFRTDASYSRYDEARKTWTKIISCTKNFARQSILLITNQRDLALKSDLLNYIMAFPVALKCHLIHGSDIRQDLAAVLNDDDLEFVLSYQHRPNCLIQLMSQTLSSVQLETTERNQLDANISQFNASASVCERLIRTPIPLSYTRLTSRFLVLWHLTLPIVLWDACNWLSVPATFFSAATLFCIEEVGVIIEEPFEMLALDKMCAIAHDNIHDLVKLQRCTEEHLSKKMKRLREGSVNGAGNTYNTCNSHKFS